MAGGKAVGNGFVGNGFYKASNGLHLRSKKTRAHLTISTHTVSFCSLVAEGGFFVSMATQMHLRPFLRFDSGVRFFELKTFFLKKIFFQRVKNGYDFYSMAINR